MIGPLWRHPEFRVGARDFLTVAPGIGTWGLMTGVAMVDSGMHTGEAVLMSLLVFAGSAQLAALPLLAVGAPIWVILAAAFCVNLRFAVFSAHLRPYVIHQPTAKRLLFGYLMADISYVFFVRRFPQPATDPDAIAAQEAYWLGSGGISWIIWSLTGLAGLALGHSVPARWGLGFAGVLALVGITASLIQGRMRQVAALVAGVVALLGYALPLKLNIVVAILAAVAACLLLERWLGTSTDD